MKYPEFREQFKDGEWFGGHIVRKNGLFYKLVKTEEGKVLMSFTYDELKEGDKEKIAEEMSKKEEEISRLEEFVSELLPARNKLIDYVKKNGKFVSRSNISESEYYSVKAVDGMLYKVRISSHVYPTGSMTSMLNNTIDTTDYDCREFLKLFGL